MITVSAPGKINLMGEHAIVYGNPSLLSAVNLRTRVTIEPGTENTRPEPSRRGELGIEIKTTGSDEYVRHIVEVVQRELNIQKLPALKIMVTSEIPSGYHLGSSAAVAVGTVGALVYFLTKRWNLEEINDIAYEAEKKMHGNPSGGDNTAITHGGFLWFRKELEKLKLKAQLPITLTQKLNHFFLINTGRSKESTGEMVADVQSKVKSQKSKFERIFAQNEKQTKQMANAILEENEDELINAIQKGERTLEAMGVVSKKVIPLIRNIEATGGAAKILGGGGVTDGVGFLLCYAKEPKRVGSLCFGHGYKIQSIQLGEDGVRLEKI